MIREQSTSYDSPNMICPVESHFVLKARRVYSGKDDVGYVLHIWELECCNYGRLTRLGFLQVATTNTGRIDSEIACVRQ